MRFYRPRDGTTLELRHPRTWCFFFGPFYLLRLKLWVEAVTVGIGTWALVHWASAATRNALGGPPRVDVDRALTALAVLRTTAPGTPAGDQALRELLGMMLPVYAGGFALLGIMVVLTAAFPWYLKWRMRSLGWEPAPAAVADASAPAPAGAPPERADGADERSAATDERATTDRRAPSP